MPEGWWWGPKPTCFSRALAIVHSRLWIQFWHQKGSQHPQVWAEKHFSTCVQRWESHVWKGKVNSRLMFPLLRLLSLKEIKSLLIQECCETEWELFPFLAEKSHEKLHLSSNLHQSHRLSWKKTSYWTQTQYCFSFTPTFRDCQSYIRIFYLAFSGTRWGNVLQSHIGNHLGFVLLIVNLWRASVTLCLQHCLGPVWWAALLAWEQLWWWQEAAMVEQL